MDKAPDAFRTISEVADYLETPAHVLRFWETRFPQVKPVKGAGGRRYYRPSDVALLSGIRRLLHTDGMTIRGVQKILRDQGVRHVAELGGEVLEAPEPLADLLPPAKVLGEVVPLRPAAPLPEASPSDALAAIRDELPPPDEALDLGDPSELPEAALLDQDDAALADETPPGPEVADPSRAAFSSFGGFGLDLDVPRDGEGGFIAFSNGAEPAKPAAPQGLVAAEARPKRPAPAQPSFFDLTAPEEVAQSLIEDEDDEAPHVFVEDDHEAEVTAFPGGATGADDTLEYLPPDAPEDLGQAPEKDPAPQDLPASVPPQEDAPFKESPDVVPPEATPDPDLAPSREAPFDEGPDPAPPEDAPFEDVPDLAPSDLAPPDLAPPDLAPPEEFPYEVIPEEAPDSAPWDAAADSSQAIAPLAGVAARLRPLMVTDPDRLFAIADLQARLGLLQAQMVEAATRPRRAPGH